MNARLAKIKAQRVALADDHTCLGLDWVPSIDWLMDEVETLHDLMRSAVDPDGRQWWDEERMGSAVAFAGLLEKAGLRIRTLDEMPP